MRTVIDNLQLHYSQQGSEAAQPVLLLHGWGTDLRTWAPITPGLEQAGFNVYALDLPGFGLTPAPNEPWDVPMYTKLVKTFIEKRQLSKPILVGHSFGGRISIMLAADHPELVSKIILINSAGVRIEPGALKKLIGQFGSGISPLTKGTPLGKLVQPLRRQYYNLIGAQDYINAQGFMRDTFVRVVSQDLRAHAARIDAPALLIWGATDEDTPLWTGQLLHETIVGSTLVALEDVGHFAHIERPETVITHILQFLGN